MNKIDILTIIFDNQPYFLKDVGILEPSNSTKINMEVTGIQFAQLKMCFKKYARYCNLQT